jgi:hypothetical protein
MGWKPDRANLLHVNAPAHGEYLVIVRCIKLFESLSIQVLRFYERFFEPFAVRTVEQTRAGQLERVTMSQNPQNPGQHQKPDQHQDDEQRRQQQQGGQNKPGQQQGGGQKPGQQNQNPGQGGQGGQHGGDRGR